MSKQVPIQLVVDVGPVFQQNECLDYLADGWVGLADDAASATAG
jgi:hypothetical protein